MFYSPAYITAPPQTQIFFSRRVCIPFWVHFFGFKFPFIVTWYCQNWTFIERRGRWGRASAGDGRYVCQDSIVLKPNQVNINRFHCRKKFNYRLSFRVNYPIQEEKKVWDKLTHMSHLMPSIIAIIILELKDREAWKVKKCKTCVHTAKWRIFYLLLLV